MTQDENMSPIAAPCAIPANAIGLRTKRYGPATTRRLAVAAGKGVPRPIRAIATADQIPRELANASVPTIDRTAIATTIAPGGQYPEVSLTTVATILVARKIGIFTTVVDELLADFPTFASYVQVELQRQVIDAENWQVINGDGTGQNLLGLLNVPNTMSRVKAPTDLGLDTIEQGVQDLRSGPSYCEPDSIIIHPSTWSAIRRVKATGTGNYLLGNPGESPVNDVWGVPVLQTTQIAPGIVIIGNLNLAAQVFVRAGITISMTNSDGTDFTNGKVKIRTEERLTLGVARPTALNVLTGF